MRKIKIFLKIITACALLLSSNAQADGLKDVFDNISTSSSNVYKSKTRTAVSFGAFSARAPVTTFTLFDFTPPKLSAGCNGIDMHLGGFSFVSGIDFQQLVENVSQNALGLVVHLAISVGCEKCQSVLETIQGWAQMAAEMAVDSCKAAQTIVKLGANAIDLCGAMGGASAFIGMNEDASAASKRCQNEVDAMDSYLDTKDNDENGQKTNADVDKCDLMPNRAWCTLVNLRVVPTKDRDDTSVPNEIIPKTIADIEAAGTAAQIQTEKRRLGFSELIMNMAPDATVIINPDDDATSEGKPVMLDPVSTAQDLYMAAVCGDGDDVTGVYPEFESQFKDVCSNIWDKYDDIKIKVCKSPDEMAYKQCASHDTLSIKDWARTREFFDGEGLYLAVFLGLEDIKVKFENGTALSNTELGFLSAAPIPLYQLFNLSVTYPDIAEYVIKPSTRYLADVIANQYFLDMFSLFSTKAEAKGIDTEGIKQVKKIIQDFTTPFKNDDFKKLSNANFNNDKAFRDNLLINLKTYQQLLINDIADKQFGANLSASFGVNDSVASATTTP